LLQINGQPFEQAVAPVLAHLSGERQAFRMICFLNQQEVCWAMVQPVQGEEMAITFRRGTDEPQTIKVPLISLERYRRELPAGPGRDSGDVCEFHHDGRTCYWRYNSFNASDGAKKAIDAVFKDIRERGVKNLVIDLRFNGGGNSNAAEHILNYITSKPYCIYSRVDVKVSRQFLKVQRLGTLGPFARLFQGHVVSWRFKNKLSQPPQTEYKFNGSVYAIVGPYTFSTASDFAHVLEDFDIGTLVGEETGGLRQCFGDCPSFRMPHSNVPFSVSTKRFYAPIPKPGDATHGTVPDIPITDEELAPFADAKDPEVAFILDLIEKQPAAK
jgi:C-terminal processing protease CtpA/Prc